MKRTIIFLMLSLSISALAQNKDIASPPLTPAPTGEVVANTQLLSMHAQRLVEDLYSLGRDINKKDTKLIERYGLVKVGRRYHVLATLHVVEGFDETVLRRYKAHINTRIGNILTVNLPTRKFVRFAESGVVEFIEITMPVFLKNEASPTPIPAQ